MKIKIQRRWLLITRICSFISMFIIFPPLLHFPNIGWALLVLGIYSAFIFWNLLKDERLKALEEKS